MLQPKDKLALLEANKEILEKGLVSLTWGNVSVRVQDSVIIKPSGIDLSKASHNDMSVVDCDGRLISGLKPSVDTPAHLEIYKGFSEVCC